MRELILDEAERVSGAGPAASSTQAMFGAVGVLGGTVAAAGMIIPAVASPEILRALVITGLFSLGPAGMVLLPAAVVIGGCMAGGFAGGALGYAVGGIATLGS